MAMTTTPTGLQYEDTKAGTGAQPKAGEFCEMHYTGWVWVDGKKGTKFDSSHDRGNSYAFPLGKGKVIKGWDEGVSTMKAGGSRTLIIPPDLAYGARGLAGLGIPPGATLYFEVQLLRILG